jgi:hypothetical protein
MKTAAPVLIALLTLHGSAAVPVALAAEPTPTTVSGPSVQPAARAKEGKESPAVAWEVDGGEAIESEGDGRITRVRRGRPQAPPVFYIVLPKLGPDQNCIYSYRRYYPDAATRDLATQLTDGIWERSLRS